MEILLFKNIFMDFKSYELIQNTISLDELIPFILDNVNPSNIQPISIKGYLFEVEFHPKNDYLSFTYTVNTFHYINHKKCHFRNSLYLYSKKALNEYDKDFSGETLLLFTNKKILYVIPHGENDLKRMDWATGKLTPLLQ